MTSEVVIVLIGIFAGMLMGVPLGIGIDEIWRYRDVLFHKKPLKAKK